MKLSFVLALFSVVAYSTGQVPEWFRLGRDIPNAICGKGMVLEWITLSPCTEYPCSVKAGSKLKVQILGKFAADAKKLKGTLSFKAGSVIISEEEYDPCQTAFKCPVAKGVETPASGTIKIPELGFAAETPLTVIHQLRNEYGEKVSCFQFELNYMP